MKTMQDLRDRKSKNEAFADITNQPSSGSNVLKNLEKLARVSHIDLHKNKLNSMKNSFRKSSNNSKIESVKNCEQMKVDQVFNLYANKRNESAKARDNLTTYQRLIEYSKEKAITTLNTVTVTTEGSTRFQGNKIIESYLLDAEKPSDYALHKELGQGAYAKVKLGVKHDTKEEFAIKLYEKTKLNDIHKKNNVRREISLLKNITHPNIMKLFKAFEDFTHVNRFIQIYLVMELIRGRSLVSFVREDPKKRLTESEAKSLIMPIVSALHYIHSIKIVHRDLKLDNILIDESKAIKSPKIIDFGFAIQVGSNKKLNIFCGTPSYMAPEIIAKREYYGDTADVWALGVILYFMLHGDFPFKGATERDLFRKISSGDFLIPSYFSKQVSNLLNKMLKVPAHERISVRNVLFFNEVDE